MLSVVSSIANCMCGYSAAFAWYSPTLVAISSASSRTYVVRVSTHTCIARQHGCYLSVFTMYHCECVLINNSFFTSHSLSNHLHPFDDWGLSISPIVCSIDSRCCLVPYEQLPYSWCAIYGIRNPERDEW